MYQRILLAFDGSPDGREALAQAESVASACGAAVHLVAIIDPSESMLVVEAMSFIPDNQRFVIQAVLDEAVRRLKRYWMHSNERTQVRQASGTDNSVRG